MCTLPPRGICQHLCTYYYIRFSETVSHLNPNSLEPAQLIVTKSEFLSNMSSNLLRASKRDEVGSSKYMTTDAILYRDGTLAVDVYTENKNPFSGLRGRVIVVARNANGEAIAMSQTYKCTTRGGVLDIFCQSSGRDKFVEDLGEQVGADAVGLDIAQQDEFMGNGVNFGKIATVAEQVRLTSANFRM